MKLHLHPWVLLSHPAYRSVACDDHSSQWSSSLHKAEPFTLLLPWHQTCASATGDPSDKRKGLCLSREAHLSLSHWHLLSMALSEHLLVSQTAFACLHSSLLVLTHIENEGANTLTWVITLRLLVFFLSFPASSPQNKRINSKRIKII